jgi:hypothetical protein
LTFSNVRPLAEATHSPLMKFLWIFGGAMMTVPPMLARMRPAPGRAKFAESTGKGV